MYSFLHIIWKSINISNVFTFLHRLLPFINLSTIEILSDMWIISGIVVEYFLNLSRMYIEMSTRHYVACYRSIFICKTRYQVFMWTRKTSRWVLGGDLEIQCSQVCNPCGIPISAHVSYIRDEVYFHTKCNCNMLRLYFTEIFAIASRAKSAKYRTATFRLSQYPAV